VSPGSTATFDVTPKTGYFIASVTGCGGNLSGSTYTTGAISSTCTVTASFAPAFTWLSGSNTMDTVGVYGTLGTAAATNVPGARSGAASWTDRSGNLWLLGGAGFDSSGGEGDLNDLWRYSISSGQWTWVSGSSTVSVKGIYGTQGSAAATNVPGGRYGAVTWTDSSGNLWLFGGYGHDSMGTEFYLNDLWQYSISSGQWTWVKGSSTAGAMGIYGTKGSAAATNVPGAREYAVSWMDSSGNLWLIGGNGYDSAGTNVGYLNDLWEFSPASGQWVWVSGSSTAGESGIYGTQGNAAAGDVPGARYGAVSWTDTSGNLWLFGGDGYDAGGLKGYLNDLWQFSPASGLWTWVSGSLSLDAPGVYGTQGSAAAANVPGTHEGAVSWTDSSGNLWLFGGFATDSGGNEGYMHDLWRFSPASGQWTWISGSSTAGATGIYGTKGSAAATNVPGAREYAVSWTDSSGNLWLFGGKDTGGATGYMNDLWLYPTQ